MPKARTSISKILLVTLSSVRENKKKRANCHKYNFDIGNPCYDLLTAVKTRYPLTSIA